MLISFGVIPTSHKQLKDAALNASSDVTLGLLSWPFLSCALQKGVCQVRQRGGLAINVNKDFTPLCCPKQYEWITFVETFIYAAESPSFSPTAAVVTARERERENFSLRRGQKKATEQESGGKMDGSGRCVHTYTIKGRAVVKRLEGEKLWAVGETLDQQEADYIAQGFRFANPPRTKPKQRSSGAAGQSKVKAGVRPSEGQAMAVL